MGLTPLSDHDQEMPELQGHAIGFVDTQTDCDHVIESLNAAGIPNEVISVFRGDPGIRLLNRIIGGSSWGEAAEDLLKQAVIELGHGHFAVMIDSRDREQALAVANASAKHRGHGFSYFGELTDERLTR